MKRLKNGIRISETGKELLVGNVFFYIVGQIIILILAKHKLYVSLGFLFGVLISTLGTINMIITVEETVNMKSKGAEMHLRKTASIRLILTLLAMVAVALFKIGDVIGLIIGVMALKVSAYLQPFTHKVLAKKSIEKGR